jgi:hypothetical protein
VDGFLSGIFRIFFGYKDQMIQKKKKIFKNLRKISQDFNTKICQLKFTNEIIPLVCMVKKDHIKCCFSVEMSFCEFEVIILVITEGYSRLFHFCLVLHCLQLLFLKERKCGRFLIWNFQNIFWI